MLSTKEKRVILKQIIQSDAFNHSQVYQDLLSYLFEASINNNTPKEFTIATDVFKKDSNFDPSHDTIVRVYIYNLRKKLDYYYSHEGLNDSIRVELPKGHYEITFSHNQKPRRSNKIKGKFWFIFLSVLLLSNLFIFIRNVQISQKNREVSNYQTDAIWKQFLSNDKQKQLILGDHFFFVKEDNDLEKRTILRKDGINSLEELEDFKAQDLERRDYIQMRFPMFPRNSVWPMVDILSLLIQSNQKYKLNYASNVKAAEIKNEDIIFLGSFHTLFAFNQTFRNSQFNFEIYPNHISYYDETTDSVMTYSAEADPKFYHTDFGIIRKIPGPNKNIVFIFSSFHETGTIGIVKFMTHPDSLQSLEHKFIEQMGYVPEYFEILFKATGYDRTTYATTLLHIREISPAMRFW
ncbi:hypothetical protein HQ585_04105 [candidate division KSB1 bacterium]|nr:hypothetical protein [candidate division KSB1 bacterium]